jgi:RimJ/RimL family protein N-acetyltransferase
VAEENNLSVSLNFSITSPTSTGALLRMSLPIIETSRLFLRPLRTGDAPEFLALAGDWDVARMTSDIPHPLLPSHAKAWLEPDGSDVRFAIELGGRMIGCVGYFMRTSGAAELGFWLGRNHWGLGFATEAAGAVVKYGFSANEHQRFSSAHFVDNPASGRVLAKIGFEPVGLGPMWCSARGENVDAIGLWLTRDMAEAALGPMPDPPPRPREPRGRIGRWLDQARRVLKEQART